MWCILDILWLHSKQELIPLLDASGVDLQKSYSTQCKSHVTLPTATLVASITAEIVEVSHTIPGAFIQENLTAYFWDNFALVSEILVY